MAGQGASAARRVKDRIRTVARRYAPFQAAAVSVSAGVVTIQEPGSEEDPFLQGVPMLRGAGITDGDMALILPIGDGDSWIALGAVDDGTDPVPIGRVYHFPFTLSNPTSSGFTASTSSTTVYADALVATWSDLPDGTYDITLIGSLLAAHSASGTVNIAVECAGAQVALGGIACPSSATPHTRLERATSFTAVVAAGGVTLKVQFKSSAAGTSSVMNPSLLAIATRIG